MEMGGVEKVMLSLLANLDREKYELTVLLNLNQGELRNEIPSHVRKVYLAKGKEDFFSNLFIHKIQLFLRRMKLEILRIFPKLIDKFYLKTNYDIEVGMTYNDFAPVLNSSNKNSKKIGWFHSEIQVPGLQPAVQAILKHFPQFDQMIYCSKKIMDLMHLHYPDLQYPKERVIINAIPIEEIKKKSEEIIHDLPPSPVFVSVGRLHYRKGYHQLITAHAKLISDGFPHKIAIIGEGEHRKKLEDLIKEKNVEESFFLLGNRMNPYPYIRQADFFILPSESEAWPLVIAEALILKKPIIATDTGDVSKMIRGEETGILISYNIDDIYRAMKLFLTNEELISKIAGNLKNIEEEFDNKKIFDSVENIIIQLIEE